MADDNCLELDLTERISWKIGSKVLIRDHTKKPFVLGTICKIYTDSNGEWLVVQYEQEESSPLQRFSQDIKPYSTNSTLQSQPQSKISESNKEQKDYDPNQIFCWYPSDAATSIVPEGSKELYLRNSPFSSLPKHALHPMKKLLKFDEEHNIYYFALGQAPLRLQFSTSHWVWPTKYSIFMWVKWKKAGTITTFDSSSYTPIYGNGTYKKLGCASGNAWKTMDDYELVHDKWQCVVVFGGNNCSRFHIGDVENEPTFVGSVGCDIAGRTTYRMGNGSQGPGDVGCIIVFDEHKSMKRLIQLYYQSMIVMGNCWNETEAQEIKQMLMQCIEIEGIVLMVFDLILGRLLHQFEL
eukprot:126636_1